MLRMPRASGLGGETNGLARLRAKRPDREEREREVSRARLGPLTKTGSTHELRQSHSLPLKRKSFCLLISTHELGQSLSS